MLTKKLKNLSGMQLIALGFFILILIGALLLMLPVSSRQREVTPFLTALFTATSAKLCDRADLSRYLHTLVALRTAGSSYV